MNPSSWARRIAVTCFCVCAVLNCFATGAVYATTAEIGNYQAELSGENEFLQLAVQSLNDGEGGVHVSNIAVMTDWGGRVPMELFTWGVEPYYSRNLKIDPATGAWGFGPVDCPEEYPACDAAHTNDNRALYVSGRFTSSDTTTVSLTMFQLNGYPYDEIIWQQTLWATVKMLYPLVLSDNGGYDFGKGSSSEISSFELDPDPYYWYQDYDGTEVVLRDGQYYYYYKGDAVTVTAIPVEGFVFLYWIDYSPDNLTPEALVYDNPVTLSMTGFKDYHAVFDEADLALTYGPYNPGQTVPDSFSDGPVAVVHAKLKNASQSDAVITALPFTYSGEGSAADISKVSLYRDSGCSGEITEAEHLQDGSIRSGAIAFTGLSETLASGESACYLLGYTFSPLALARINSRRCGHSAPAAPGVQTVCPCADYGAGIAPEDVEATLAGTAQEVLGATVSGSVNAGLPPIAISGEATRTAEQQETLADPLAVQMSDVAGGCAENWRAHYEVCKSPAGAVGYRFSDGTQDTHTAFTAAGVAELGFTTGDKGGEYTICVTAEPAEGYSYTCTEQAPDPLEFSIYVGGIELSARHDGDADDTAVRTFISNIEASNKLTATPQLAPDDPRTVTSVTFDLDGNAQSDTAEPFEATYDMQDVTETSSLQLSAELSDGSTVTEVYSFYALPFPGWIEVVKDIQTYIDWGFEDGPERYQVSFTYPGDFIWDSPIPSNIPLLGGEENSAELACTMQGWYDIRQESGFSGNGEVASQLLGNDFEANGTVEAAFDREFNLKPGATATFAGSITFEIPEKTLASKTILVYGVPVTLAVDLGGNVQVFVGGTALFDDSFRFEQLSFAPGTTITLDVSASASAVFGAATIGVRGSPTGTLLLKLSYTSADGISQDAFGGEIEVELSVFGSLFWGAVDGDLADTTLGPYSFGDDIGSGRAQQRRRARSALTAAGKRFYSLSSVAADSSGRELMVRTADTATSASEINPEIVYRLNSGSGWSAETAITANSLFEMDPAVTFLAGGTALALWTSNDGAKTLASLSDILAHQDIACSYFNGSSWSAEALVIDDDATDGSATVAYDATGNTAMAVWFHDGNAAASLTDRSGWSLYSSVFNAADQSWSTPGVLNGTDSSAADYMPAVTTDAGGGFVCFWIRDDDGTTFTELDAVIDGSDVDTANSDCNVYYSRYTGGSWSTPNAFTPPNSVTEQMVDAATGPDGTIAVVWVQKEGSTEHLQFATYAPATDTVGTAETLDTGAYLIEDPQVAVDSAGLAKITYRKHSGAEDELYMIDHALSGSAKTGRLLQTVAATPRRLTRSDGGSMWLSAALTAGGDLLTSWSDVGATAASDSTGLALLQDTPGAALSGTVTESLSGEDNGSIVSLDITVPVQVTTAGTYSVAADLLDNQTNVIAGAVSAEQSLAAGTQALTASFAGREIRAAGINGPYTISAVSLIDAGLSPVIIDTADAAATTAAYRYDQFAPPRLTIDKTIYSGTDALMQIRVVDDDAGAGAVVVVDSSAADDVITLALTTLDNGTRTATLGFSTDAPGSATALVANGATLSLTYVDADGKTWHRVAGWRAEAAVRYGLTVAVDPPGSGTVSADGISCPENCFESYSPDTTVRLSAAPADGYGFVGWDLAACGTDETCTFSMDADQTITALFVYGSSDNGTGRPGRPCPARTAAAPDALADLYRFRDRLQSDTRTAALVAAYYRHAAAVSRVLLAHPDLLMQTRQVLRGLAPVLARAAAGRPALLKRTLLEHGLRTLTAIAADSNRPTAARIDRLCEDLMQGELLQQLGIIVQ